MVTPGYFKTRLTENVPKDIEKGIQDLIPLHRLGNILDIGNVAAYLVSDFLSGYSRGRNIVTDGGLSLRPLSFFTKQEIYNFNYSANKE